MKRRVFLVLGGSALLLCSVVASLWSWNAGPATTNTVSSKFSTLAERIDFLNDYLRFQRTYETLDFHIQYLNGGSFPPGPSDWDIRLIATVPASELQLWVPAGGKPLTERPDLEFLESISTTLDLSGVYEWYRDHHSIIGIDRIHHIVVYQNASS